MDTFLYDKLPLNGKKTNGNKSRGDVSGASGKVRVLCALSSRDQADFLGHLTERLSVLHADMCFCAEGAQPLGAGAGGDAWAVESLQRWRPEIILSGWSTLALPREWIMSSECSLRYVCHLTGSVKALVPRCFFERGGMVSNWGRLVADTVAEHALLLALGALRNLGSWRDVIGNNDFTRESAQLGTRTLFGRQVGIHGFGGVAQALVRLLRPFGVQVRSYSEGVPSQVFSNAGVDRCASLRELFSQSDVLFECEGLTDASRASVNAEILSALPDKAVFVNVARGQIVDEPALLQEAKRGRIRLALDVVSQEPLLPSSPFFGVPESIFSPHIGGPTSDLYPGLGEHAVENIERFLRGEKLIPGSQVSLDSFDRAT
jgi:phosphoglycerate dehydrogenase-like enzyme